MSDTGDDREVPQFSVVIPTYQRERLLARAVESVLAQTHQDFELLIQDDGSTDGTRELVSRWFQNRRMRYERQAHRGRCAARNRGAERARGRFLAFLDSDDEVVPDWLARFAALIEEPVALACCGMQISVDGYAGQTRDGTVDLPRTMRPIVPVDGVLFRAGTFVVRNDVFAAVGGYAIGIRYSENTELSLRVLPHVLEVGATIASIPEPLVRVHQNRAPPDAEHRRGRLEATEYLLEQHGSALQRDPIYYARYCRIAGANAALLGRFDRAQRHFGRAFWWGRAPRDLAAWVLAAAPGLRGRVWREGS